MTLWNQSFLVILSLVYFFTQLRLLYILRYTRVITTFNATLSQASTSLLSFGIIYSVCMFGFSIGAFLMFRNLVEYSSFGMTLATLMSACLGKFDFVSVLYGYGSFGALYLLIYLCLMYFIVLNMLVTIINDSLAVIQGGEVDLPEDYKVIDHMIATLASMLPSGQARQVKGNHSI